MTPNTSAATPLPIGPLVTPIDNPTPPRHQVYRGQFVSLTPVDAAADAAELYAASNGDPLREQLWTYMSNGPFANQAAMQSWLEQCQISTDPLFFPVTDRAAQRRVELGHIWYAPEAQRTAVNTESIYLMLCESFDQQHYRRVEWKCDSLNARSRAAALRLGFQFEGIFRQHLIVRGRNRDTAWFAMTDGDWPRVKANLERWLYSGEAGLSLTEMNRL